MSSVRKRRRRSSLRTPASSSSSGSSERRRARALIARGMSESEVRTAALRLRRQQIEEKNELIRAEINATAGHLHAREIELANIKDPAAIVSDRRLWKALSVMAPVACLLGGVGTAVLRSGAQGFVAF